MPDDELTDNNGDEKQVETAGSQVNDEASESLDFSDEDPVLEVSYNPFRDQAYNRRRAYDKARKYIAYSLIGLLWIIVCGILLLVGFKVITIAETKEFSVILGPIVALVSAATGFYYGTKDEDQKE